MKKMLISTIVYNKYIISELNYNTKLSLKKSKKNLQNILQIKKNALYLHSQLGTKPNLQMPL